MNVSFFSIIKQYRDARQRRWFFSLYDLPQEGTVLDISCGRGDFLSIIHSYLPKLELHGADISPTYIDQARARHSFAIFAVADAASTPYHSNTFHAVFSSMSLHHYRNPERVFYEIARVLRPNGVCYVLDLFPHNRLSQILHNTSGCSEPYHFERYYRIAEVETLAKTAGLTVCARRRVSWLASGTVILLHKRASQT